jgi:outer membrane protein assembly factor BamB
MLLALGALAYAQFGRGAGEWNTTAADAQRSAWVRSDPKISAAAIRKGGFGVAWKLKLTEPGSLPNAFAGEAVLLNGYIGYRGFRSLGYIAGSNGHVYAVDTDLGRLEWQKPIGAAPRASGGCAGGMTANVARPMSVSFPPMAGAGRGNGRLNPAKSAVGAADEGATNLAEIAARDARMAANPPAPRPTMSLNARRLANNLHAVSADGVYHSLWVSNGEEHDKAVPFLPANAEVSGLIVLADEAYAVTSHGCGGAPNAVWALDLETGAVTSWKGDIAGTAGTAFAPDGTVFVATASGQLAALAPKTLAPKATYESHSEFTSSPVLFQFGGKTLVAAAAKDNRLHLLDTAALDRPLGPQPLGFAADALATWQDTAGTRWILASSPAAVTAWKLVQKDGAPAVEPGWTSKDMASPGAPMIVNGVVFAFARGSRTEPAALYALDGETGAPLWNSAGAVTLARGPATLSAAGMQVYLATRDGVLYAFGFPIEH